MANDGSDQKILDVLECLQVVCLGVKFRLSDAAKVVVVDSLGLAEGSAREALI